MKAKMAGFAHSRFHFADGDYSYSEFSDDSGVTWFSGPQYLQRAAVIKAGRENDPVERHRLATRILIEFNLAPSGAISAADLKQIR